MKHRMIPYKSLHGNSGVVSYRAGKNFIVVKFVDGSEYLYDQLIPGQRHVKMMKKLAAEGKGLSTFISRHVRERYSKKLN